MYSLGQIPLFTHLQECQHILLAGTGEKFDILSAIPLFFALKKLNKKVSFCQFSKKIDNVQKEPYWEISENIEQHLCKWLKEREIETNMYAFEDCGVEKLKEIYQLLLEKQKIDAMVIVDSGVSSVLSGDESQIKIPAKNVVAVLAVNKLQLKHKYLSCMGFGLETKISHAQFLENVAALTKEGGFLGTFSLLSTMEEVKQYIQAIKFSNTTMGKDKINIENNCISSAIQGKFGKYFVEQEKEKKEAWINPLMSVYWSFQIEKVAARFLYPPEIAKTRSLEEVMEIIQQFRNSVTIKPHENILV